MKKKHFLVLVLSTSLLSPICFAAAEKIEPKPLNQRIDTVLKNFDENINIGILVQDAKTGQSLYRKDVNRYFTPASNQKLFTAFAALQALGPNFTYQTTVYIDPSKVKDGKLSDNLYLQFTGDPTLNLFKLEQLINSVAQTGIQAIKGKVIVDDTAFDQMAMSPGTAWEDQNFCWGAPISSLIVEHNCVTAKLLPANQANQLAILQLPSHPQSMHFVNQVVTQPATTKNCIVTVKRSEPDTYTLSGCIKEKSSPQIIEMAVSDPRANLRLLLTYLFKKNEIETKGKIVFEKLDAPPKPLAIQNSPPLKTLVSTMLKKSDNTIADALFKTLGAAHTKQPGSFKNGNLAVRDILAKSLRINFPKTTFIDGSGGSRYNFLTPQQVVTLLQQIFLSANAADFKFSLAIAGMDGTLKDRMREPTTQGRIYAKTGSETGVTSLSGYVETKNQRTLIFSIMINGITNLPSKYKTLEDSICKILAES